MGDLEMGKSDTQLEALAHEQIDTSANGQVHVSWNVPRCAFAASSSSPGLQRHLPQILHIEDCTRSINR